MFRQGDIVSYTENRNSSDSKGSVSFGIYLNMCRLKRKITLSIQTACDTWGYDWFQRSFSFS